MGSTADFVKLAGLLNCAEWDHSKFNNYRFLSHFSFLTNKYSVFRLGDQICIVELYYSTSKDHGPRFKSPGMKYIELI